MLDVLSLLDHSAGSACKSDHPYIYDFDLDGLCEYQTVLDDDAMLISPDASMDYRFYWCVSDQDDGGQTGTWNYQMDNAYAQY
ncbi:MAG TPA: hypothetical protein ENK11_03300, partial [Phycisphaerales bacterium]|nr:hypothetical protein [Phycisphaerales bacterium]